MTRSKKLPWTQQETVTLIQAHKQYGNKWTQIAAEIPGRTSTEVKNRFYAIKRKYAEDMRAKQDAVQKYYPNERVKLVRSLPKPPAISKGGALPKRRQTHTQTR